ncbi:hypothetical protein [Niabella soli]|uniref:DUF4199 domain-containing protein n=1 Tax=Niabella soli DSM 19437 TaxID=929713 RepID=W0F4F5_9BACT|nr:hypothetical protein [Niabella soli]AHF16344.1 hypothetical protein NIASO_16660 [Niabella soli DSM 19437]
MNWNLIFKLSFFGLAMALGTVYFIPSAIEPFCWLIIFIICAYFIAKNCSKAYFLHGFMVSIFNCVWITAAHILLFDTYIAHHPSEAALMTKMPMPDQPKLMMLMTGAVIGIASGIVLGLFAFAASKIIKKPAA